MATTPIETKVSAATLGATVIGVLVTVLNTVTADSALLGPLPPWLQLVITLFGPPLAVFLSGYAAPHTPRL